MISPLPFFCLTKNN